jgi:hypothetical protein
MAIEDYGRKGLLAGEEAVQRLPYRRHLGVVQRRLTIDRGIPGGQQKAVALSQRDVQVLCQVNDELPAGARTPGFYEAQVSRRNHRFDRQV